MNAFFDGIGALMDVSIILYLIVGLLLGFLVGAFPGITATMAVALAAGFTMTLEPVQGLAVLLTIYVAANFGDRVPSILINTPGTPASIATTLDGYPMAKQGRAGLALTMSAIVTAIGILASLVLFSVAAVPVATFARDYFRSPELFALVVFGISIMIGISSKSMLKGILAGLFGLMLGTVGTYAATADHRFTFGVLELVEGVNFIAVIIGLFGIAELFDQMLTHSSSKVRPISSLGRCGPPRASSSSRAPRSSWAVASASAWASCPPPAATLPASSAGSGPARRRSDPTCSARARSRASPRPTPHRARRSAAH